MKNEKVKKDETRLGAAQNDVELNLEKVGDKIVGGINKELNSAKGSNCVRLNGTLLDGNIDFLVGPSGCGGSAKMHKTEGLEEVIHDDDMSTTNS